MEQIMLRDVVSYALFVVAAGFCLFQLYAVI